MKLAIKAELVYTFAPETQVVANIEASQSNDQTVISESLDVQPPIQLRSDKTPGGDRSIRGAFSGEVTILYQAVVENNLRRTSPTTRFRSCCLAASVHRTSSCDLPSVSSVEPATAWRV
jgi:hypothetical protein